MRRTKKERGIARRTVGVILVGTVVASLLAGFAVANVVTVTGLTQEGSSYSVSESASPNWPNPPNAQLAQIPSGLPGAGTCTGPTTTYPGTSTSNYEAFVYLSINGSTCAVGDQADQFVFGSPSTLKTETVLLEVSVTISGTMYDSSTTISVAGGTYPAPAQLQVFIDLGPTLPPGGVAALSLTLT